MPLTLALLVALLRVLVAVSPVRHVSEHVSDHASWHVATVPVSQELEAGRAAPAAAMPRAERTTEHARVDACDVPTTGAVHGAPAIAARARTLTTAHAVVVRAGVVHYLPNAPPGAI